MGEDGCINNWAYLACPGFSRQDSIVAFQSVFRRQSGRHGPQASSIRKWNKQFHGKIHQGKGYVAKPSVTAESVDKVRESVIQSHNKSLWRASRELQITESKVTTILQKRLKLSTNKLQLVQKLQPNDPSGCRFVRTYWAWWKRMKLCRRGSFLVMKRLFICREGQQAQSPDVGVESPGRDGDVSWQTQSERVLCRVQERVFGPLFYTEDSVTWWGIG